MAEFLIEIGLEEIPAPWLPGLAGQLRQQFEQLANRASLAPENTVIEWTPRRLVLSAAVLKRQPDRNEVIYGPPLKMARNHAGEWTPAALGFAKKAGCRPEDLREGKKEGAAEPYLLFEKATPGSDARQVLPALLAATLRALAFPKRMNWDAWIEDGKGVFPFGRPIRWLVALLDGEVVPVTIHAAESGRRGAVLIESSNTTYGHRFLPRGQGGRPIAVKSAVDLRRQLAAHQVILAPAEREQIIRRALAPETQFIRDDHGLPGEWRDLVEYPTVVIGRIPDEFHQLPVEVLETVLVHHQKYIPLRDATGSVTRFAAIINNDAANADEIVRGMERVVVARLRDAAFFYAEDFKRPLASRVDDLSGVTFQQGLGNYKDKAERMARLIETMGVEMGLLAKVECQEAREAARLAKADLTTLLVREFPELQGAMGGIHLRAQGGQHAPIAEAVRWHYHPLSIESDAAPAGRIDGKARLLFAVVSLADKIDSLAGYFGLGLIPSGSSDPYGLRRAAQGVIRVLLDFWKADAKRPSLRRLIAAALNNYERFANRDGAQIAADLEAFLLDRLRFILISRGFPADEVEAALSAREPDPLDDVIECQLRIEALHRVRAESAEDFEHLAVAFKRARNIIGATHMEQLDPGHFREEAERELHAAVVRLAAAGGSYDARLRALAGLREPVDRFFDDVMVMVEDERLRANRLALLGRTLTLFFRIADIAKLAPAQKGQGA